MKVWFISYTTPEGSDVVRCFPTEDAWNAAADILFETEGLINLWGDVTEMEG